LAASWSGGCAVEQALAEFAFEAVDLGDQGGVADAEGGGRVAERGVAAGFGEAVQPYPAPGPVIAGRRSGGAAAAAAAMSIRIG
jgi:hypothetical protein